MLSFYVYFREVIYPASQNVFFIFIFISFSLNASEIKFNTDFLDAKDRKNIDLAQFSQRDYIMPGTYILTVNLNKEELSEQSVLFIDRDKDRNQSVPCLSHSVVQLLALRADVKEKLTWWHNNQCLDLNQLPGTTVQGDLSKSFLNITMPQSYLEYSSPYWDPPSRWDNGISGVIFDYNINAQEQKSLHGNDINNISGNGTLGANFGSWRIRADWQARFNAKNNSVDSSQQHWDWSRYYAYRAFPNIGAKFMAGENYLTSDIFDSFRFAGVSLATDDSMLPPNLRGYAPEVTGIARTNAKVIISQQGRILKEVQVAPGTFHIEDLDNAITGSIDVKVEESDGSVHSFTMDTANIPYLTRPGTIRYKFSTGRPIDYKHDTTGHIFAVGEASLGINNGWSVYGGALASDNYNALNVGVGRDLMAFGALSFDVTQSQASFPDEDGGLEGRSYRLSYSKRFEEYDSQISFAGYRFSDKNYISMYEYINSLIYGYRSFNNKELYTVSVNKQFREQGASLYINYNHQTYWDAPDNERYTFTLSKSFDVKDIKNVSLSLSAYRNQFLGVNDDGMYLSLSLPFGNNNSFNYSNVYNHGDDANQVSFFNRFNDSNSYQLNSELSHNGSSVGGYYTHDGDVARISANTSYHPGKYSSLGISLQGGGTATSYGAALHRSGIAGGTRVLIDTDGVAGIPIQGYGAPTRSNIFGKAVVAGIGSYYRNRISVDINSMPNNAEVTNSVVQATLTEGAIGYRHFDVISGQKAIASVRLANGSSPPFGAVVLNKSNKEVGIINEDGSVYLSGIIEGSMMSVHWGDNIQCVIRIPEKLTTSKDLLPNIILPCR